MAVFAQLDDNNIVINIISVSNDDCGGGNFNKEYVGISYCKNLYGDDTTWRLSSEDGKFRGNTAGIGMTYINEIATLGIAATDIFIEQQPYPSWSIGVNTATWYSPFGEDIRGPGITTTVEAANNGKYYISVSYTHLRAHET